MQGRARKPHNRASRAAMRPRLLAKPRRRRNDQRPPLPQVETTMTQTSNLFAHVVQSLRGDAQVTVENTNFGYLIRSTRTPPGEDDWRRRAGLLPILASAAVLVLIWSAPGLARSVACCLGLSLLVLAAGAESLVLLHRAHGGIELHVDRNRQELRSAVTTANRTSWIRATARFSDVSEVVLRQPDPQRSLQFLSLRIAGEAEFMPVAVGSQETLLCLYDRLCADLRTGNHRPLGGRPYVPKGLPSRAGVFPTLGPEQLNF